MDISSPFVRSPCTRRPPTCPDTLRPEPGGRKVVLTVFSGLPHSHLIREARYLDMSRMDIPPLCA